MAEKGSKVVGSIALRVWADARNLTSQLLKDLKLVEQELPEIEVKPDLDKDGLKHKTKEAVREAQIEAGDLKIDVDLDKDRFENALKTLEKNNAIKRVELSARWNNTSLVGLREKLDKVVGSKPVTVRFNDRTLKTVIDQWRENFNEMFNGVLKSRPANIPVGVTHDFKTAKEVKQWYKHYFNKTQFVYEVHPAVNGKDMQRAIAEIKRKLMLERFGDPIKIPAKLDPKSLPNLARDLRKQLARWKEIELEVDSILKPRLDRKTLNQTRNELTKQFTKTLDELSRGKLFKLKIDTKNADRQLKQFTTKNHTQTIKIHPTVDTNQIDQTMQAIKHKWMADRIPPQTLRLTPNMDEKARLDLYHKLHKIKKEWDNTELDFKTVLDKSAHANTYTRLKILTRDRWVKIRPIVDNKAYIAAKETLTALAGYRMSKQMWTSAWDVFKNIDKNLPKIFLLSSGIATVTSAVSQASVSVFGFARGLVQMFNGAALVVPAFTASAVVGLLTLKNALSETSTYASYINDDLKRLKKGMNDTFWSVAGDRVKTAWRNIFDEYEAGRKQVAASAGNWFATLSSEISRTFSGVLKPILDNMGKAFDVSARGARDLSSLLAVLLHTGSQYLPRMAGWVNQLVAGWADWARQAQATGKLDRIIERAGNNLRDLAVTFKNLGLSAMIFGRAIEAEVGPSLENARRITTRWLKMFETEGFTAGLRVFVRNTAAGFRDLVSNMSAGFKQLSKAIAYDFSASLRTAASTAGKVLGNIMSGFAGSRSLWGGLDKMFSQFAKAADVLRPAWRNLADMAGVLAANIGRLAVPLAEVARAMSGQMLRAVERLAPLLAQLGESLAPVLASAINRLVPLFVSAAEAVLKLVDGLLRIPGVGSGVVAAFIGIAGAVKGLMALSTVVDLFKKLQEGMVALKSVGQATKLFGTSATVASAGVSGMSGAIATATSRWGKFGGLLAKGGSLLSLVPGWGWAAAAATVGLGVALSGLSRAQEKHAEKLEEQKAKYSQLVRSAEGVKTVMRDIKKSFEQAAEAQKLANKYADVSSYQSYANWKLDDHKEQIEALGKALGELGKNNPELMLSQAALAAKEFHKELGNKDGVEAIKTLINSSSELKDSLNSLLIQSMLVANEQGRLNAIENLAAVQARANAASQLQHESALMAVQQAMNGAWKAMGYGANASKELAESVSQGSKSFIDFSARAKNGAELSATAWVEGIKRQLDAQKNWQANMEKLTRAGVDQGVLQHLARMGAEGQHLVDQFAKMPPEKMREMLDGVKGAFQSESGSINSTLSSYWQGMITASDQAIQLAKQTISARLTEMATDTKFQAAKTPEAMAEALTERAGISREAATALIATTMSGLTANDLYQVASAKGSEAVDGLANTIAQRQGIPVEQARSMANAIVNALQNGFSVNELAQIAGSGVSGFNNGINAGTGMVTTSGYNLGNSALTGLSQSMLGFNTKGAEAGTQFSQGVGTSVSGLPANVAPSVANAASGINAQPFNDAGRSAAQAFITGFNNGFSLLTNPVAMQITQSVNSISLEPFTTAGQKTANAYISGFTMGMSLAGMSISGAINNLALTVQVTGFTVKGQQAATAFGTGFNIGFGAVRVAVTGTLNTIANQINTTGFTAAGLRASTGYATGIRAGAGTVRSAALALSTNAAAGTNGSVTVLANAGQRAGQAYATGIRSGGASAGVLAAAIALMAAQGVARYNASFTQSGTQSGLGYVRGLAQANNAARIVGTGLGANALNGTGKVYPAFVSAGRHAGSGFADGIYAKSWNAYNAGCSLGRMANAGLRATLIIRSPSRLMAENGEYTVAGFVDGITRKAGQAYNAGADMAEQTLQGVDHGKFYKAGSAAIDQWRKGFGGKNMAVTVDSTITDDNTNSDRGLVVNQYIQTALVEKDSKLASAGAAELVLLGG